MRRLENVIDWSQLRHLKVSPLRTYRGFLKRSQTQLSNLKSFTIGKNESEKLPVRNWSGDIGCPSTDNFAAPIYYSSLLQLRTLTKLLLAKGADVHAHGGRYEYPLPAAVYSGDLVTLELLLNHGGSVIEKQFHDGAHVNAKSRLLGNALQMAACKSNMAIVEMLLNRRADFVSPGVMFDDVLQICLCKDVLARASRDTSVWFHN
ncbi:hypothetical protein MMC11_002376 [Xylographa trunciseda]|nr:hypothetical protein [Xylographa trunciseda]